MKKSALCLLLLSSVSVSSPAQETAPKSSAIEGVKGVEQKGAPTVKYVDPQKPKGVEQVEGIKKIEGTKTPAPPPPNAVQPVTPPPPPNGAATTVNKVEGIKAPAPNAVKAVPPPPAGIAVSSIRPVQGVTGIQVPKLKNLEAVLKLKDGEGNGGPKAAAAAAALGNGEKPGPPQPGGDGRAQFQEFEKLNTKGS